MLRSLGMGGLLDRGACWLLLLGAWLQAAQPATAGFEDRVFRDTNGEHRYSVFLPDAYSPEKKWPVVLFLHGAGERGSDGRKQLEVGLGPVIRAQAKSFPFIAVFPQCEDTNARYLTGWLADTPDALRALAILSDVERDFSVDTKRRVLSGWSMGGYGTWSIAAADPSRWSAIVPLSGGGEPGMAPQLRSLPTWAFHGSDDGAIRPQQSRSMIAALQKAGGNPRYTEVTGGGHDIAEIVYGNSAVQAWMLNPQGSPPTALTLGVDPAAVRATSDKFRPAMDLSGAVTVRLGNHMLEALAMSVPDLLPKDIVRGGLNDMYDSTEVEGRAFSITFGGISYAADVKRVRLNAYRAGRLNVQVGIENAQLYISGTSVVGRDHSASTGPIQIVIGHRYPVWLSVDVEPQIVDRKFRLRLVGSRFDIPNDNWYVTAPAGVSVSGFGMTREKVSNGLVSGLYGSKARIEREVQAAVPRLLHEMEKQLSLSEVDQLVNSFWPLPVYRPEVRLWPQDVSVDEHGLSVILGVTAAAMTPESVPDRPAPHAVTPLKAADLPQGEDLQLAVAPQMLGYLTQLLVDAGVARIHVLDIPERAFADLVDRSILATVFPELKSLGDDVELSTELSLRSPINIGNSEGNDMLFSVPRLQFDIQMRKGRAPGTAWTPFATIHTNVNQAAHTRLERITHETRSLQLIWAGEPAMVVQAEFSPDYKPADDHIDQERLTSLLVDAWQRWSGQGPAAHTVIPDLDFGMTSLRLSEAAWKSPFLGVTFSPPGVRITNNSSEPLAYETKSPFSAWGGPYTLEPGKSHNYEVSYPLIYRQRINGELVEYTLPTGTHSEYRAPRSGGEPRLFKARETLDLETLTEPQPGD